MFVHFPDAGRIQCVAKKLFGVLSIPCVCGNTWHTYDTVVKNYYRIPEISAFFIVWLIFDVILLWSPKFILTCKIPHRTHCAMGCDPVALCDEMASPGRRPMGFSRATSIPPRPTSHSPSMVGMGQKCLNPTKSKSNHVDHG